MFTDSKLSLALTPEDVAINRMVAKRIGSWEWLDSTGVAQEHDRREYSISMTLHRVRDDSPSGRWYKRSYFPAATMETR